MKKLTEIILSRVFLVVFSLVYIIFIGNVASAWARLSGKFSIIQLLAACLFYGAVYTVILSIRHHYKTHYYANKH